MTKFFSAILAGLALVAFANSASADTNLLSSDNYSFEDPVIADTANNNGHENRSFSDRMAARREPVRCLTLFNPSESQTNPSHVQ